MLKTKKLLWVGIIIICIIGLGILCACNSVSGRGEFFCLQDAYEQGLLTRTDLLNISYYQNADNVDADFVPKPKNPIELSRKTQKAIKETFAYNQRHSIDTIPDAKTKSVTIQEYYGTYNGCIALLFAESDYVFEALEEVEIDGVKFYFSINNPILIWRKIL